MDSSVSLKDEIWFLRVCHHISNAVYLLDTKLDWSGQTDVVKFGFKIQRLHEHLKNIFLQLDTATPLDRTSGISNTSQYCKDVYSRNVETVDPEGHLSSSTRRIISPSAPQSAILTLKSLN